MVKFKIMKNLFGFIFYFLIMFLVMPIPYFLFLGIFYLAGMFLVALECNQTLNLLIIFFLASILTIFTQCIIKLPYKRIMKGFFKLLKRFFKKIMKYYAFYLALFIFAILTADFNKLLEALISSIFIVLWFYAFCLYFILPLRITKRAMKNNWSSYLNFFFNNVFLLTLVLIILFIATIFPIIFGFSDEFIKVGDFIISQTLLFFILPVYFLIYLTSLIEKIKKNWLSRL